MYFISLISSHYIRHTPFRNSLSSALKQSRLTSFYPVQADQRANGDKFVRERHGAKSFQTDKKSGSQVGTNVTADSFPDDISAV